MTSTSFALTISTLMACALATAAAAGDAPVLTGKLGDQTFLMDANKMTLYTFDKDETGKSNCYDQYAVNWPPLAAAGTELPKNYSLIQRDDGTMQLAYKGQPLYLWIKHKQPGDMIATASRVSGTLRDPDPGPEGRPDPVAFRQREKTDIRQANRRRSARSLAVCVRADPEPQPGR